MAELLKSGCDHAGLEPAYVGFIGEESRRVVSFDDRIEVHEVYLKLIGLVVGQAPEAPSVCLAEVA